MTDVVSLRSLTAPELETINEQPTNASPLFPTRANRLSVENWLTDELLEARERVIAGRVTPARDLTEFKQELAHFDFSSPKELTDVLTWTIIELERGLVHVTHPRSACSIRPRHFRRSAQIELPAHSIPNWRVRKHRPLLLK